MYEELCNAIILQAIKDFKPAYRRLKRFPDDKRATATVKEITEFFCSEYFTLLSDADGPRLLRRIIEEEDARCNSFHTGTRNTQRGSSASIRKA